MAPSHHHRVMPTMAAQQLCRNLPALLTTSPVSARLSAGNYQHILAYCNVRPDLAGWRNFLTLALTVLGLLALVAGSVFFIAGNWQAMSVFVRFALVELLILALATIVWQRWYDAVARTALLALGLSFGGLFALYGQVYQTGADAWQLFFSWACVLLPLALIGRQNGLWLSTWAVASLAFQLYYASWTANVVDPLWWANGDSVLLGYLLVQTLCLIVREALAARAAPSSWLARRWPSWMMAGYVLLMLTLRLIEVISDWRFVASGAVTMALWGLLLLGGYAYYRQRAADLCMLTLGVTSIMLVGCALIYRVAGRSWEVGPLFAMCALMTLWLLACGALLLRWRRTLAQSAISGVTHHQWLELLAQLRQRQWLTAAQSEQLMHCNPPGGLPWYLHIALAISGWLAAMIILLLLALLLYVSGLLDSLDGGSLMLFSLFIAIPAAVLLRKPGIGIRQIGLAWAIAASCGLSVGIYLLDETRWLPADIGRALWLLPVLGGMAWLMPDRSYRFMASAASTLILLLPTVYLAEHHWSSSASSALLLAISATVTFVWLSLLHRQQRYPAVAGHDMLGSLGYGIPAGLALSCLASIHADIFNGIFWHNATPTNLPLMLGTGIAIGLIAAAWLWAQKTAAPATPVLLPAAVICGSIAVFAPGIGFGLALLLLARYQGRSASLVAAAAFLLLYLIDWYYFLGISLLQKSLLLVVSGLMLLALLAVVRKTLPPASGDRHVHE